MNNIDPFASVRLNQSTPSESSATLSPAEGLNVPEDSFSHVRIKKAEGFPFIPEAGRHIKRLGSRLSETIGGIPGDFQDLVQSGVFSGLEKLVGVPVSGEARESVKKDRAPTSSELKGLSQKHLDTSPKNDIERSGDEYIETFASLLGPFKFRKALGVATGAQLAKEGLKISGVPELGQEAGKVGTMVLMSVFNPKGALKYSESMYKKAQNLSKGASVLADNFKDDLLFLQKDLGYGLSTPGKSAVLGPIKELLEKIAPNGKILIKDLMEAKRNLHSLAGDPAILKGERKLFRSLGKKIDNAIKPYEKINPKFSKAYRPANEIYGAIQEGSKASNFIKKVLGSKSVLGATLIEAVSGHPEYILPTIGTAASILGGAHGVDFFVRLAKSPHLQKFYAKAITSAVLKDANGLRKSEEKIREYLD